MRSLQTARPLTLFAPAKVNLGLEVCGRRDDGYHNVVTVMETVSLFDVIRLEPGASLSVISEIESAGEPDLVRLALERLQEALDLSICVRVHVEKRIPVAAGLGGGSSDAGTVLAAMRQLFDIDAGTIHGIASGLGSDVPFFLGGRCRAC